MAVTQIRTGTVSREISFSAYELKPRISVFDSGSKQSAMAVTDVDVNSQIHKNTLDRFQNSLCSALPARCQELRQLMQEASLRDIQGLFPSLIVSIFGFQNQTDWGLTILTRNNSPREFESLRNFLNPDGPLLFLCYRLLAEGCPQYKFPTSCLPLLIQNHGGQTLEESSFSSLFSNKLSGQTFGSLPSFLRLNAFEFYFFHFAYYITRQETEKALLQQPGSLDPSHTLYAVLLEDYLNYFLPVDGSSVPAVPLLQSVSSSGQQSSPTSSFSSGLPQSQFTHFSVLASPLRPSPHQLLLRQRPSLLKPGTPLSVPPSPGTGSPGNVDSSPAEIWRSEAFVFILSEMYLSQITQAAQRSRPSSFLETFIPNSAHVWMVRTFIKYLHYFANSAKASSHLPSYSHMSLNALEQLKCTVIQKFIRKKLYKFMKSIFDHWPLDASFKLPLEAWLSYIQPWRYVSHSQSKSLSDEKDGGNIDPKWQKFVSDNILFYTVMFQQVLKKFLRMDLSCPKNAFMLFRFSKVFSQSNIGPMIAEAESCPQDIISKSPSVLLSPSYTSMRRNEMSHSSSIRQQLSDLEVSGSEYVPFFSKEVIAEVSQLLWAITAARRKAHEHSVMSKKSGAVGWLSQLVNYFDYEKKYSDGERGASDIKKVEQNLETAAANFCGLFHLPLPSFDTSPLLPSSDDQPSMMSLTSTPVRNRTVESDELTPQQRYQLINGFKKMDVKYQGHPDTQPIRSFEIAFLVRMLWQISSFLNMRFSREIGELYSRCDVIGRMCHQLLSPPVTYYKVTKSSSMQSSPRIPVHLPPRVNLRCLANKQVVGYFLLLLIVAMSFGYHPMTVVLGVLAVVLFIVFVKALFSSRKSPRHVA